jgi:SAM-dependent methyltransferase
MDYFENARDEMLRFVPVRTRRLLDVGCGAGRFGALLKSARPGLEVWGVEPVPAAAQNAATRLDRVLPVPFDAQAALPAGYFDAVVFNDSLEHFPDPLPPLERCKALLAPGGVVVCSIPNVRHIRNLKHLLVERDWRYEEWGVRDRTHLRFFTQRSIVRTMEEAGVDVVSLDGINSIRMNWYRGVVFALLRPWLADTPFQQFAVVASPCAGRAGPMPAVTGR